MVVDNELEYNESMIVQREEEIREIEHGITELNEIFRDLGTMVNEQGSMFGMYLAVLAWMTGQLFLLRHLTNKCYIQCLLRIDSIESNVTSISMTTHSAAEELTTAAIHQKNARKKQCCLLVIVAVVTAIVVLAIIS